MACPDPYRAHTRCRVELVSEQFQRPPLPDPRNGVPEPHFGGANRAGAIKGWQQQPGIFTKSRERHRQVSRIGHERLDLRSEFTFGPHHPVVTHRPVPTRRGPDLRAVQSDPPQRDQAGLGAQRQRLREQLLERLRVPGLRTG